jgi:hypothetical protein
MFTRAARPLLGLQTSLILSVHTFASVRSPQDLAGIADPLIRDEIATLGPYNETDDPYRRDTLVHLPLRSSSASHLEFAADDIRVRLEAFPFEHSSWVKKHKNGSLWLDSEPVIGWGLGEAHSRVSRAELVIDGLVCAVPASELLDVFDPRALASSSPEHWCFAARSKDGYRVYLQVLAGAGEQARSVTWVFEYGEYLFRVVDPWKE